MAHQPTIGLLLPHLNAGYDMDVLTGVQTIARQRGVRLIAIWGTPHDIQASALARDQIAGWIAVLNSPKPEGIHALAQTGVPIVLIGALVPDLACPPDLAARRGVGLGAMTGRRATRLPYSAERGAAHDVDSDQEDKGR